MRKHLIEIRQRECGRALKQRAYRAARNRVRAKARRPLFRLSFALPKIASGPGDTPAAKIEPTHCRHTVSEVIRRRPSGSNQHVILVGGTAIDYQVRTDVVASQEVNHYWLLILPCVTVIPPKNDPRRGRAQPLMPLSVLAPPCSPPWP